MRVDPYDLMQTAFSGQRTTCHGLSLAFQGDVPLAIRSVPLDIGGVSPFTSGSYGKTGVYARRGVDGRAVRTRTRRIARQAPCLRKPAVAVADASAEAGGGRSTALNM